MVSVWLAVAAWLIAWTVLAWLSNGFLQNLRPGEKVPMLRRADGTAAWRAPAGFAVAFTPVLSAVVGLFTIGVSLLYGRGQAPVANVLLAVVFVAAHWMHLAMASKVLEQERL